MLKSLSMSLIAASIVLVSPVTADAATTIPFTFNASYHFSVASGSGSFTTSVDDGSFGIADITSFSLGGYTSQLADGGTFSLSASDLSAFSGTLTGGALTSLSFTTNNAVFDVYAIQTIYEGPGTIQFSVDGLDAGNLTYSVDYAGVPGGGFGNLVVGSVPEPATWVMMIGGIGVAGGAMRRRRGCATTAGRFA